MKILVVSTTTSNELGSYNQRLLNLKEGLNQNGVATEMLYLGDYFFRSPVLIDALNIPWMRKEIDGYDAVHGGSFSASYVLGLLKKMRRFNLITDVHGCIEESILKMRNFFDVTAYIQYFEQIIAQEVSIKYSDFFITCSKPLRERLLQRGIEKINVEVIRNGVNTDLFKPKDLTSDSNDFVVTYAGAFQKWQGIENLIAAAELIKVPNVKYRIIGFRKKDQVLKNTFKKTLGSKVELIDALSQSELIDQFCLSDILIIPRSRHCATQMAFPTKFPEYIATGRPVIVTDVDETATFVRKYKCGFICKPNAESIARTILKAKQTPREVLIEMGKNGRFLAESHFNQRVLGKKYSEFLRKILS